MRARPTKPRKQPTNPWFVKKQAMEKLFSYGTLQQPDVQMATFGRVLEGTADALVGYVLTEVEITDEQVVRLSGKRFHPMLKYTRHSDDTVEGMVFQITAQELAQADVYEVSLYARKLAQLRSGGHAWIYAPVQID
ncbi:MAG: AIG2-like family protein [Burkholderiaceae bacterium]|nr:AIG2-like family protein [Burkholderiaceae bacterium]